MTKSVSKVLTTSTVVAAAATAINQAEALNDHPQQHRLSALQEEGEDASASTLLHMRINVESISKPKFQEKEEPVDLGILVGSIMKNGDLADTVSHALDQMEGLDKQDLFDELHSLAATTTAGEGDGMNSVRKLMEGAILEKYDISRRMTSNKSWMALWLEGDVSKLVLLTH